MRQGARCIVVVVVTVQFFSVGCLGSLVCAVNLSCNINFEAMNSREDNNDSDFPSFSKNSCPGNGEDLVNESTEFVARNEEGAACARPDDFLSVAVSPKELGEVGVCSFDWTKSLEYMPAFDSVKLDEHLIANQRTVANTGKSPKAYRNKKQGYKLWKEGYVKGVMVKPHVKAARELFLVKGKVHASMKPVVYQVYVHLDQVTADVCYAQCSCKAGKGGCYKHIAALLYTLVDFHNMELVEISPDLSCTQIGQKWSVPSKKASKAFKFDVIYFEKFDESKKRKRQQVNESRESYCATPKFAWETSCTELEDMVEKLRLAGKAEYFCAALESNNFQPCANFVTSCSKASHADVHTQEDECRADEIESVLDKLSSNISNDIDLSLINDPHIRDKILQTVAVSTTESVAICKETLRQDESSIWFKERSKRITASLFGRVCNRRQSVYPKSIVDAIINKKQGSYKNMPPSLKWGIENESKAIEKYKEIDGNLHPVNCGLVVSPKWPWLGCSPDGIIFEGESLKGAIEIKCPYSKRDFTLIEAAESDKSFFLSVAGSTLALKKKHPYYFQCQGVLNILEIDWLDFVVYTTKDLYVERIHRNETEWTVKILPNLTSFFTDYVISKI